MAGESFSKIEGLQEVQDALKEYRECGALELKQYREIGTTEECRKAREKQMPKKPIDNVLGSLYFQCPNCACKLFYSGNEYTKHDYCAECGQAIDWSDK